jgi:hypothetical protein
MVEHIDIELAFGNIDADNVLGMCHRPIPSLPVAGFAPLQLFGFRNGLRIYENTMWTKLCDGLVTWG